MMPRLLRGLFLAAWLLAPANPVGVQDRAYLQDSPALSQLAPFADAAVQGHEGGHSRELLQVYAGHSRSVSFTEVGLRVPAPGGPPRPSGAAAEVAQALLPDLRTLPPSDLEIEFLRDGGRELRLANMIWNSGEGPLELVGEFNRSARQTRVRQRIHTADQGEYELPVGEFVWHPGHDHWHMDGFALYELWSLTPIGELDQVVSSSDKVSYCMMDTDVIDPLNPSYVPRRRYYACDQVRQGLSAGWGDEYESFLEGQSLDLSGVEDGYYALKSTANPDEAVLETNTSNNSAQVYLEIRGSRLTVIPPEELAELRCEVNGWC